MGTILAGILMNCIIVTGIVNNQNDLEALSLQLEQEMTTLGMQGFYSTGSLITKSYIDENDNFVLSIQQMMYFNENHLPVTGYRAPKAVIVFEDISTPENLSFARKSFNDKLDTLIADGYSIDETANSFEFVNRKYENLNGIFIQLLNIYKSI